jgi:hypothetical protein
MSNLLKRNKAVILLAAVGIVTAGCGGQNSGPASSSASQTGTAGMASFTMFGKAKPLLTAGTGAVTVSGLSGASFTSLYIQPSKSLLSTYLAFSRAAGTVGADQVYSASLATGIAQPLVFSVEGCNGAGASAAYIAFNKLIGLDMFRMRPDGSSPVQISVSGPAYFFNPAFSPNGQSIAVDGGGEELWYFPYTGGTATLVQSNDNALGVSWTPDGNHLLYISSNSGGYNNVYETALTGGTTTDITSYALASSGNCAYPVADIDGVTYAAQYTASGASKSQIIVGAENTSSYLSITPSAYSDGSPCFSPDGTEIAFYRSSTGGAAPGIYVSDLAGTHETLLVPDPPGAGPVADLSWSPILGNKEFIGSGGSFYTTTANGFLVSQNGSQFACLVAFGVTTASTATITSSPSTSTYQPLIFTLSGDSINKFGWTNNFYNAGTFQTPPTGTTSVLVTIDAQTGQVDLVVDAQAVKSPAGTSVAGGNMKYTGKFTALYDGTGKNLAPSGAAEVVVSPTTGKLVSFR